MERQTYHPDNMSSSEGELVQSFNRALVWRWCWQLSKYHPSVSRHLNTSWNSFLEELETLANGDLYMFIIPDFLCNIPSLSRDFIWEPSPNTNRTPKKKLKARRDQRFPKLTTEHIMYYENPFDDLSGIRVLLNLMLSTIGPAIIQHPSLKKHKINLIAHQVIHDLFRLLPEERYGNWQISETPIMKTTIPTTSPPAFGTLENFPAEILCKIFHHTNLPTALSLRLVCKSWKDYVVPRLSASWSLRGSKNAINKAQLLVKMFHQLTQVDLTLVRDPVTAHALMRILRSVPLKSLSLFDVDEQLVGKLSRFHALRRIHIDGLISVKEFHSICLTVPTFLEELSVNLHAKVSFLPISFTRLAVLKKLLVRQQQTRPVWRSPTEKFSVVGLETLSKLTALHLYLPNTLLDRENLTMILTTLIHLEHLLLSNCLWSDVILIGSMGGLGKLTSLAMYDDTSLNENGVGDGYDDEHNDVDDNAPSTPPPAPMKLLFPALTSLSMSHSSSQTTLELASAFAYSCQNLKELRLTSCVINDALLVALQSLSLLHTLELMICKRKKARSNKVFTLPIRQLCIDSDSAIAITDTCCVNYPQLEHLTFVGDMGCFAWHCQWYGALRGCDKNKLLIIDATECDICQLAVRELPKCFPNTKILYPPADSIVTCDEDEHFQDLIIL